MEPCRCHHRTQKAIFLQNGLTNSQVGAMLAPNNMLQTTCKILAKRGPILRTVFWTPVWGSNLRPRAVQALALLFACFLGHPSACLLAHPFLCYSRRFCFSYWGYLCAPLSRLAVQHLQGSGSCQTSCALCHSVQISRCRAGKKNEKSSQKQSHF